MTRSWAALAVAVGLSCLAQPASALQIVMTDKGGIGGTPAEAAFKMAAQYWGSVLSNDVTVSLDVSFEALEGNIVGIANSTIASLPTSYVVGRLAAGQTSTLDASAVASLSDLASSNASMVVTSANLRALLPRSIPAYTDGVIRFNSKYPWDYDTSDDVTRGVDFLGVALHEIAHVLGFLGGWEEVGRSPLDLYRYRNDGQRTGPSGFGRFSVDGGETAFLGGSLDGSHWAGSGCTPQGLMAADVCGRATLAVTGLDLAVFDAIGWNTNVDVSNYRRTTAEIYRDFAPPAAVPEPGTWALLIGGFGLMGGALRRRRGGLTA